MVDIIHAYGEDYPAFQASGYASRFCFPFAAEVCKGVGFDIGCNREEWKLPGAIAIDPSIEGCHHDAMNLPYFENDVDYIFSSHCLEHLDRWVDVLDYWYQHLRDGGVLFLYLPDFSQQYWRPWRNRKHVNVFTREIINGYMQDKGYKNIFISGVDMNNSFMIFGEK